MTHFSKHLTRLTMIAALAAAGITALPAHAAPKEVRVIQLPTVVITAKRIQ